MRKFKDLLALVVVLLCVPAHSAPQIISIVELIVRPEAYVGKEVQVMGFNVQRRVYLTEEAARYRDFTNSISFADSREGFYDFCEETVVRVAGRLSRSDPGGYFLEDVGSVHSMEHSKDCSASVKLKYKHHKVVESQ